MPNVVPFCATVVLPAAVALSMKDSTSPVVLRHTYIARTAPLADLLRRRERELARQRRVQIVVEEDVGGRERARRDRVVRAGRRPGAKS